MATTVFDDRLAVETPEAVAFDLELAGVGSRGLAYVIDQLIVAAIIAAEALVVAILTAILGAIGISNVFGEDAVLYAAIAAGLVIVFLTGYGYHVFYEVRRNGRTPGKRVAGIRVVREGGGRVTFGTSATRNLMRIVDALPSAYLVGILAVLLSKQRQRVGDMAAGTVVIYEPKERPLEVGEMLLSEETELAVDFLQRRSKLSALARDAVAREVLLTLGEQPDEQWDEPMVAGRIAQIIGVMPATPDAPPEVPAESPEAPSEGPAESPEAPPE